MIHLKDQNIKIPIDSKHRNLPVIKKYLVSSKEKEHLRPQLRSALAHSDLSKMDFFGDFRNRSICHYPTIENRVDAAES